MLNDFHPSFSGFALTYLPYLVIFNEARLQNNICFKESIHPPARHWPDITLLFSHWNAYACKRIHTQCDIDITILHIELWLFEYGSFWFISRKRQLDENQRRISYVWNICYSSLLSIFRSFFRSTQWTNILVS